MKFQRIPARGAAAIVVAAWLFVSAAGVRGAQPPPLRAVPVTRLDGPGISSLDAPRRLSVSFATPVPVRDVLSLLVRGTPFSLSIDARVDGVFVGELKDVTLRQALESVLVPR